MKKIVLFVASVLSSLQSAANRNSNEVISSPLLLSPSDGIYNHGSHNSHYSVAFSIQHDSINNVTPDIIKISTEGIKSMYENEVSRDVRSALIRLKNAGKITAKQHKKITKSLKQNIIVEIELPHIYISSNNEIIKSFNNDVVIKMNPEEKCLLISYIIKGISTSSTKFPMGGGKIIIPLSSEIAIYYNIIDNKNCVIDSKKDWMNLIVKKMIFQ